MPRRLCVIALFFVAGCTSYTGDTRLVQGVWRIKESYGEDENQSKAAFDTQLTIDGQLIIADEERAVWRFELDESTQPKGINLDVLAGPDKGKQHRGIYHVKGDHWWLTIQKDPERPRPKQFELGEKGSGIYMIELIRVQ